MSGRRNKTSGTHRVGDSPREDEVVSVATSDNSAPPTYESTFLIVDDPISQEDQVPGVRSLSSSSDVEEIGYEALNGEPSAGSQQQQQNAGEGNVVEIDEESDLVIRRVHRFLDEIDDDITEQLADAAKEDDDTTAQLVEKAKEEGAKMAAAPAPAPPKPSVRSFLRANVPKLPAIPEQPKPSPQKNEDPTPETVEEIRQEMLAVRALIAEEVEKRKAHLDREIADEVEKRKAQRDRELQQRASDNSNADVTRETHGITDHPPESCLLSASVAERARKVARQATRDDYTVTEDDRLDGQLLRIREEHLQRLIEEGEDGENDDRSPTVDDSFPVLKYPFVRSAGLVNVLKRFDLDITGGEVVCEGPSSSAEASSATTSQAQDGAKDLPKTTQCLCDVAGKAALWDSFGRPLYRDRRTVQQPNDPAYMHGQPYMYEQVGRASNQFGASSAQTAPFGSSAQQSVSLGDLYNMQPVVLALPTVQSAFPASGYMGAPPMYTAPPAVYPPPPMYSPLPYSPVYMTTSDLCEYHAAFGESARSCDLRRGTCAMRHLVPRAVRAHQQQRQGN